MIVSTGVILLIVATSLAWSGLDTVRKLLARRVETIPLVALLTLGQVPVFLMWLIFSGQNQVQAGYFAPGLMAIMVNLVANLMFVSALKVSPFSLTIPFLSLTPIYVTLLAVPLMGEYPTVMQIAGILLAIFGALNLSAAGQEGLRLSQMWHAFRSEKGSVLMTGVALLWSINASLDKLAVAQASVPFHALVQVVGICTGLLIVLAGRTQLRQLRLAGRDYLLLLVAVLFCAGALSLELTVIQKAPLRVVAIIKRVVELNLAAAIGYFIFKEALTKRKAVAIGLMALGIVAILWTR
jgi:drug/metabolite transporter (DMT)-like permease